MRSPKPNRSWTGERLRVVLPAGIVGWSLNLETRHHMLAKHPRSLANINNPRTLTQGMTHVKTVRQGSGISYGYDAKLAVTLNSSRTRIRILPSLF